MKPKIAGAIKLPPQSEVENRLLHFLYRFGRPVEPKELYGPLADDFGLTQEQRRARRPSTGELAWNNLVRYARRRLVDIDYVHEAPRGAWRLTQAGRDEAARHE